MPMPSIVSKLHGLLTILPIYLIRGLASCVPKQKNLWVFYGWHYSPEREIFADNSKYFFLHQTAAHPEITSVWLSETEGLPQLLRARGYRANSIKSWRGRWYAARAEWTIIDGMMTRHAWAWAGNSKVYQLWHGKGMKKTGFDSPYSLQRYQRFTNPNLFQKYAGFTATATATAGLVSQAFRISVDQIHLTGQPRTDVLFSHIPDSEIDALPPLTAASQKNILYAPTFRPNGTNPLEHFPFEAANKLLAERGWHLYASLHPKFSRKGNAWEEVQYSNISFLPAGYDIYPILNQFEAMITDYSSLYTDYILLDRPLIFYTYDLASYRIEMGLYDEFDLYTPGEHPQTPESLLQAIINLALPDSFAKKRSQVITELHANTNGSASERINTIITHL